MIKAIKGYKKGARAEPELGEVQIDDDPDLNTPPYTRKGTLKTAFQQASPASAASPSGIPGFAQRFEGEQKIYGYAWKVIINVLILFPWSTVLFLSFLVNKWQLIFRPLGGAFWWCIDWLDQRVPSLVEWLLWFMSQVSLVLHVITVGVNLGVIWIMWDNGHHASPIFIITFYGFCHLCSAVTMFKELDMREAGDTFFTDVLTVFQRVLDVLFYDIQMVASIIHGNRMLEGMTQVMFKGYEEARVALTSLVFTMPCCIIMGVEYAVFMDGVLKRDVKDLHLLTSLHDQLYAAVCFSVINSVEKMFRFSVVDPWMHEKGDGFPLLYVRSHAARLPGSVVKDFLVRCKVALAATAGRLVLKEMYSHYTQQVKETSMSLSDPHKAYLLRKAVHYFNTQLKYRANIDKYPTNKPIIQELIADNISPGTQLSTMLPDILLDASNLTTLSLANNHLDDTAICGIMAALAANPEIQLQHMDLSGNQILAQGAAAVASLISRNQSVYSLSLAHCPVRDEGAMALAEALKTNIALYKLDISDCQVGPEGAIALAAALMTHKMSACMMSACGVRCMASYHPPPAAGLIAQPTNVTD